MRIKNLMNILSLGAVGKLMSIVHFVLPQDRQIRETAHQKQVGVEQSAADFAEWIEAKHRHK